MQIDYELTRDDFWQITKIAVKKVPKIRRQYISQVMVTPFVIFALFLIYPGDITLAVVATPVVATVAILLGYLATKRQVMKLPIDKPGLLGKHSLSLTPEGFREATEVNDSFTSWAGVHAIYSTNDHGSPCAEKGLLQPGRGS